MKKFSLALLVVMAASVCPAQTHKDTPLICPVTRLTIPSKKSAVAKSVYKGKTYYFCTSNCKRLFDMNPKKYASKGK
jgi:YHS domain-containing protein